MELELIRPEEYAVFEFVLTQKLADENRQIYFLHERTNASGVRSHSDIESTLKREGGLEVFSWLDQMVAADYERRNEQRSPLEPRLQLPKPFKLLSETESREIWSIGAAKGPSRTPMDGWDYFEKLYPNAYGVFEFSRIGLNRDETQAIVEVGHQWDWRAGRGELLILRRVEGNWEIALEVKTWIS